MSKIGFATATTLAILGVVALLALWNNVQRLERTQVEHASRWDDAREARDAADAKLERLDRELHRTRVQLSETQREVARLREEVSRDFADLRASLEARERELSETPPPSDDARVAEEVELPPSIDPEPTPDIGLPGLEKDYPFVGYDELPESYRESFRRYRNGKGVFIRSPDGEGFGVASYELSSRGPIDVSSDPEKERALEALAATLYDYRREREAEIDRLIQRNQFRWMGDKRDAQRALDKPEFSSCRRLGDGTFALIRKKDLSENATLKSLTEERSALTSALLQGRSGSAGVRWITGQE